MAQLRAQGGGRTQAVAGGRGHGERAVRQGMQKATGGDNDGFGVDDGFNAVLQQNGPCDPVAGGQQANGGVVGVKCDAFVSG